MFLSYIAIMILPILLSGGMVLRIRPAENVLKLLLSFSAAYILSLSFIHLLPEVFSGSKDSSAGLWVMAGFFIQLLLEFLSGGIEHGHIHIHEEDKRLPLAILLGLFLHTFLEGLPLSGFISGNLNHWDISFLTGITLHNIPVSIALCSMLLAQNISKKKLFLCLLLFSLMTPFGAFFGYLVEGGATTDGTFRRIILSLVIGIFLHIGTTILFEGSEKNHHYRLGKLISILLGAAAAWGLSQV